MISGYTTLHSCRHNISVHFLTEAKARQGKFQFHLTLNTGWFWTRKQQKLSISYWHTAHIMPKYLVPLIL